MMRYRYEWMDHITGIEVRL